jgi:hypothetical protein
VIAPFACTTIVVQIGAVLTVPMTCSFVGGGDALAAGDGATASTAKNGNTLSIASCDFRRSARVSSGRVSATNSVERTLPMRRLLVALVLAVALAGCREVRVNQQGTGTTPVVGPREVVVVRDRRLLESLGIARSVDFRHEFAVVLLMGPHKETGWTQITESIRANSDRVRIVAFERAPLDGGEPSREYRTYTIWVVPNIVYRPGARVDVVAPSGEPIASTTLK